MRDAHGELTLRYERMRYGDWRRGAARPSLGAMETEREENSREESSSDFVRLGIALALLALIAYVGG